MLGAKLLWPASGLHALNAEYQNSMLRVASLPHISSNLFWSSSSKPFSALASSAVIVDGLDCLPEKPQTPWMKLYPELVDGTSDHDNDDDGKVLECFYNPQINQVVRLNRQRCLGVPDTAWCFAASRHWLAFVDPKGDCPIYLTDPFCVVSGRSVVRLPPLSTMPSVWDVQCEPNTGKVSQFKIPMISSTPHEHDLDPHVWCCHDIIASMISNLAVAGVPYEDIFNPIAVALYGEIKRLAYTPLGGDNAKSSNLGWIGLQEDINPGWTPNQLVYSDIQRLFFTVNACGIQAYDLHRDLKQRTKKVIEFSRSDLDEQLEEEREREESFRLKKRVKKSRETMHLVSLDNGDLLLISRHSIIYPPGKTFNFYVFRVNFPRRKLERLTTIGDRCIFVGDNQSFSLWASSYPGLKPDSVYFTDAYDTHNYEDCGIFNMKNNTIDRITYPYTPTSANPHPMVFCKDWWRNLFWVAPWNIGL